MWRGLGKGRIIATVVGRKLWSQRTVRGRLAHRGVHGDKRIPLKLTRKAKVAMFHDLWQSVGLKS